MRLLPVDTAVTVFVNCAALIDDTDFKTREEAVVFNQAGLDLVWNFQTPAGVITQTAVTPTNTGGDYDWTNVGNGMYKIEIPALDGATINNNAEGYGFFSGFATGILPWVGPTYAFVPAHVVNGLVAGSDYLQADVVQWVGDPAPDILNQSELGTEVATQLATYNTVATTNLPTNFGVLAIDATGIVDANVEEINTVTILGTGAPGDEFRV